MCNARKSKSKRDIAKILYCIIKYGSAFVRTCALGYVDGQDHFRSNVNYMPIVNVLGASVSFDTILDEF